ncbi:hypothetical protein MAY76_17260 [Edwardsiella ictaluri]|nr:hypothetical protein [Edwardsiella ictaluri]WFO09812.1 hypothetical protein MAY76_17260 [Edwardsiella ictaluri]
MSSIDISLMRGEQPRIVSHLLPETNATLAQNCHFRHGVITPLYMDKDEAIPFSLDPQTLFHYRDDVWFTWAGRVQAIRSPVAQDQYDRVYFTDGRHPQVTSAQIASQGHGRYPAASYRLGIPAPEHPPTIGEIHYPEDEQPNDPLDDETRFYVETYVTAYGEEGPPGPVSREVSIPYPGSRVTLHLAPLIAQNHNISRRRIYRTVTGGGAADYLLVTELALGQESYVDALPSAELGGVLETYDYLMPPDNMVGLCLMANGIAAAFAGNEVMFSEPYLPYAWPGAYRQSTEHNIVAIAALGTVLVVVTQGYAYLFSGVSPGSMTSSKLPIMQACLSTDSMVEMDGFVLYAAANGLVSVDAAGNALVATEAIVEPRQWRRAFTLRLSAPGGWRASILLCIGMRGIAPQDLFSIRGRWIYAVWIPTLRAPVIDWRTNSCMWSGGGSCISCSRGTQPHQMRWRSRVFLAHAAVSFACLRVLSPQLLRVGVQIVIDGEVAFSLPPGALTEPCVKLPVLSGRRWQIECFGTAQVERLTLSTSMDTLPP